MLNNLYSSLKAFGSSLNPIILIILGFLPFTILISFLIWIYNINKNVQEIHDMFSELVKAKRAKEKKEEENKKEKEAQQMNQQFKL